MENDEILPMVMILFICILLITTEQSPIMVLIIAIIGAVGIAGVGAIKASFGS
ncbi:MAG: hypothetical protein PWQ56_412 [Patescibacteria group bacterium]|nr:hypothetical protein [Patescibacteria group bacterium]